MKRAGDEAVFTLRAPRLPVEEAVRLGLFGS